MANGNIRGITIEIGGDTTGLENALKDVNKQSKDLQTELKEVERGLKLDPGNVELVRQKQQLLTQSIEATSDKLHVLRQAQGQVEAQFRRGEIGEEQYRAFRRELVNTENNMRSLQGQLNSMQSEQQRLADTTRSLGAFFDATGTDVEQFAGTLGTRLTQAIRNGTASADQMERALRLMGRQALGASTDIDEMRRVLGQINNGGSINAIRTELQQMNTVVVTTQGELKEIDKLLKFNPNSVELLTQKQALLTRSIQDTSTELQQLQQRQSQVEAQFRSGQIGEEQYRAFRREIEQTEQSLVGYQNQLNTMQQEQQQVQTSTRHLQTLFDATGTSVDQFADAIGNDLVRAIQEGRASSTQIEQAIRQIGQHAVGAEVDIEQLREALRNVDNGANLDDIRADINRISQASNEAEQSVKGLGDQLGTVIGGLAAGGGIAGAIDQALDVSSLNTDIAISMNLNEEDTKAVRQSIMQVTAAIGDNEAAYEGVRRQMTLNKDASIETNQEIIMGAATISRAYKEIDFKELIQESHEIGKELGISQQAALGLVNGLLDIGFPPEQLDIISEYGSQLVMAGYNAEQVQAIMASGVATGTWNIDILLDGLKEGRIVAAEFGQGIDKAMQDAIKGTNISEQQLVKWGQAVASGGQDGVKAMQEMNQALSLIDDDTKRNEIGVKMYGTLWEEQGGKVSQTIQGMNEHIRTAAQNTEELNSDMAALESDPAYQLSVAVGSIKEALAPVLGIIADLVAKIGEWVSENATLFAAITAIVATLGILTGAFAVLMPAIAGLISVWPVMVAGFGAVAAPIAIAVAAIAGLGAAFVALWQNSETFRNNLSTVFEAIKNVAVTVFEAVASFIGEKIAQIKGFWDTEGAQILQAANNIFNGIKAVIETVMPAIKLIVDMVWTAIKQVITGALDIIMGAVKVFSGLFTGDFSKMWEGIKQIFNGAIQLIIGWLSLSFFGGIKTLLTNLGKTGLSLMKGMWDNILGVFKSVGGSIKSFTDDTLTKVVGFFKNFVTNVKTQMSNAKQKIIDTWDEAVAFLKNINLEKIGKDIINGLIKGIGSMASMVVDKVKEVAQSIPDWAKKVLGIHSPSRVMMELGEWVGIGLANGIKSTEQLNQQMMQRVIDGILAVKNSYKDQAVKIDQDLAKAIKNTNEKANEDIAKIQKTAASKKRALTSDEIAKIYKLRSQAAESILKLEEKAASDRSKLAVNEKKAIENEYKDLLGSIKSFISDKKSLDQLSLKDEVLIWEQSLSLFEGSNDQRIAAQKEYKNALQALNDEIVSINKTYTDKINTINENLLKQETELTKAYEDAVSKRASSLASFASTFSAFSVEVKASGVELLSNLQSQVDGFKQWQEEFAKLSSRNIDADLLAELSDLGVKALPELMALNQLTDEQLTQYSALYQEKAQLARTQAETELIGMRTDTQTKIDEMRKVANTELSKLQSDWAAKIRGVTEGTKAELSSLKQIGRDAGQGLLNGLASMQGPLVAKAFEIAEAIRKTIQSALEIHSPSRVMKGFGINIGEGLIIGMDDMISKVAQSSARLSEAIVNAQGSLANSTQKSMQYGSGHTTSTTSTTVDKSRNYNPTFQIYTVESPEKVIKREMRKMVFSL